MKFGFMSGCETTTAIFILRQLQKKYLAKKKNLFFTFADRTIYGKGEAISLIPLYHFHLLHRLLDVSWAITLESSPLHIACSQTESGNLWFSRVSC